MSLPLHKPSIGCNSLQGQVHIPTGGQRRPSQSALPLPASSLTLTPLNPMSLPSGNTQSPQIGGLSVRGRHQAAFSLLASPRFSLDLGDAPGSGPALENASLRKSQLLHL